MNNGPTPRERRTYVELGGELAAGVGGHVIAWSSFTYYGSYGETVTFGRADIEGITNSHADCLCTGHPQNAARFETTRSSDREAAIAIVSAHAGVAALFNNATAAWAPVSEPHWRQGISSTEADPDQYTKQSVFI